MRPARRRIVPVRTAGRSGLRGCRFLARRMGRALFVEHLGGAVHHGPRPVHPPMAAPRAIGKIATAVAARLARSPVKAHEPPAAILKQRPESFTAYCAKAELRFWQSRSDLLTVAVGFSPRSAHPWSQSRGATLEPRHPRTAPFKRRSATQCRPASFRGLNPTATVKPRSARQVASPHTVSRDAHVALVCGYLRSLRRRRSRFNAGIKPPCHL